MQNEVLRWTFRHRHRNSSGISVPSSAMIPTYPNVLSIGTCCILLSFCDLRIIFQCFTSRVWKSMVSEAPSVGTHLYHLIPSNTILHRHQLNPSAEFGKDFERHQQFVKTMHSAVFLLFYPALRPPKPYPFHSSKS